MPSHWEIVGEALGLSRRKSGRAQERTASDSLHFVDENELVICRCRSSNHEGNKRVRDDDLLIKSSKHFTKHPDQYQCAPKGYWEAPSKSRMAQRPSRDIIPTNAASARGYTKTERRAAMAAFRDAIAKGCSPFQALDYTTELMSCVYDRMPSESDIEALIDGMRDDLTTVPRTDTESSSRRRRSQTDRSPSTRRRPSQHHRSSPPRVRGRSHDTRRVPIEYQDELQCGQLHNQLQDSHVSQHLIKHTTDVFTQTRADQLSQSEAPTRQPQQQWTPNSNPGPASVERQTAQTQSQVSREPGHVSSNSVSERPGSMSLENEVGGAKSVYLHMILEVFPDIEVDYVLALVDATVVSNANVGLITGSIIERLLAMESYPKNHHMSQSAGHVRIPVAEVQTTESENPTRASSSVNLHPAQNLAIDWPPQNPNIRCVGVQAISECACSQPPSDNGCLGTHTNSFESRSSSSQQSMPKSPTRSTPSTSDRSHGVPARAESQSSFVGVNADSQSATPSSSASESRRASRQALESLASPSQDPWRTTTIEPRITTLGRSLQEPENDPLYPMAAPVLTRSFHAHDLDDLVTTLTHNAWKETPDRATPSTHATGSSPSQSGPSDPGSTSFLSRLEAVRDSSMVPPQAAITPERSGSAANPDIFVRGSALSDPFTSNQTPANPPQVGISTPPRRPSQGEQAGNAPRTPVTLSRRGDASADDSPSARVAERRSKRRPFSPVNIEGGYEYINAEDARYEGDVSAASAGSPWIYNPRSFAQPPTSDVQESIIAERGDQHQCVQFESPVVNAEHSPAVEPSPHFEEDATPPLGHQTYQPTPERKKKKTQSKGGPSSGR
jgi:hypothetical protein